MISKYITTPIYYLNDIPHLGHAYTTLAADMIARFWRLEGRPVKFVTGTDEHGQKIAQAAEKAGLSPQEHVDKMARRFEEITVSMGAQPDDFIRTTQARHIKAATAIWQKLVDQEEIYLGHYAGWYAVRDEAYYDEKELINGVAPTGAPVEWVEEPCYFFRLSKWQEPLLRFYKENPDFIGPSSRRNEVIRFVSGGLHDLSVSRSTFSWGVPVPGNSAHVMYVWIEALTNYITALGYPDIKSADFQTFWPESLHIVGKDILRFHAVYWPAFLMAAQLPPPKRVYAHGWWTNEGQKISKSLGNVIDPLKLIETYGLDPLRYFLLREVPFGQDGDFSPRALKNRLNSDLANDLGNLVQRVLAFIQSKGEAKVPQPGTFTEVDQKLLDWADGLWASLNQHIESQSLNRYLEHLWEGISLGNQYMDHQQPWTLRKSELPEDQQRLHTVLYTLIEVIRQIALFLQPVMPTSAGKILDQLAVPLDQRTFAHQDNRLVPQTPLPVPQGIFPRFQEE